MSVPITEERNLVQFTASGHVNFFAHLEEGQQAEGVANKEHEEEKKKEQEDYEKQIGLLTYLGQGSRESTGETAWYEKPSLLKSLQSQPPEEINHKVEKSKDLYDPLRVIRHYIGKPEPLKPNKALVTSKKPPPVPAIKEEPESSKKRKRKSKKEKKSKKTKKKSKRHASSDSDSSSSRRKRSRVETSSSSSSSSSSDEDDEEADKKRKLQELRAKRLQREKAERARTNQLLAAVHGIPPSSKEKPGSDDDEERATKVKPKVQKYHSQYNPELAKQNQPLDSNTKYWLQ